MVRFVEFKDEGVWVNPDQVTHVFRRNGYSTNVYFADNRVVIIEKPPELVIKALLGGTFDPDGQRSA